LSKKKKLSLVVSLFLTMALVMGATMAFLTSQTPQLTNTFVVGENVSGNLFEVVETYGNVIEAGQSTGHLFNVLPGDTVMKAPFIELSETSVDAYAFIKVSGIPDATIATLDFNLVDWELVEDLGGGTRIYGFRYRLSTERDTVTNTYDVTDPLFGEVSFANDVTADQVAGVKIVLQGLLVQADNNDFEGASEVASTFAGWQ